MRGWLLLALLLGIVPATLVSRGAPPHEQAMGADRDRPLGSVAILARLGPRPPIHPAPPADRPWALKQLIAERRIAARDEAVRRNAAGRKQCEVHNTLRRKSFGLLHGNEPATPGPAFGGLRVDGEWFRPADGPFPIHWEYSGFGLYATVGEGDEPTCGDNDDPEVFCPFRCTDDEAADCRELHDRLDAAWGQSDAAVWRDKAHRVRAVVRLQTHEHMPGPADCELRFQRYVSAREWIAMNETAQVPLGLLGQSRSKLPEEAWDPYGGSTPDDAVYDWNILVTGSHMMAARVEASVVRSRIVELQVEGEMDPDGGADEIHELVRPFRGRGLRVTLETNATTFKLVVAR